MLEPLLFIYEALGVPSGLLTSEEAKKRSAAAQLLRRTPNLRNILDVSSYPFTDELWTELEIILSANERVIDVFADALDQGELDPIIGGFPDVDHRRPMGILSALYKRVLDAVGPESSWQDTVNNVADALAWADSDPPEPPGGYAPIFPEGTSEPAKGWLRLIVAVLIIDLAIWAQRQGWPIPHAEAG